MARSKGSLSTVEAKELAKELSILVDKDYKYNFNIFRLIELLLCQKICEQLWEKEEGKDLLEVETMVEIPLIGELTVIPRVFHAEHGITKEPSVHFDFSFKPTSGFKADLLRIYNEQNSGIGDVFAHLYGERLQELYKTYS